MQKIDNSVKITLIIVAGILILGLLSYSLVMSLAPTNTVSVSGQSTIKAQPDLVSVYFNAETKGNTTQKAKEKNDEITNELINKIIELGFERSDIQTQNFNIYPEYDWEDDKRVEKGYKATHSIKIEFSTKNTEKISDVVDTGVNSGALLDHINFELSEEKQKEYKAEAMKKASQDVRIKAESVADGLGQKLGDLVSVSVNDFNYQPWRAYDSVASEETEVKQEVSDIQPSEKEISASVTAKFKVH